MARLVSRSLTLPGGLNLLVQMPDGSRHTFDIQYEWSVAMLKQEVGGKINRPVGTFDLRHGSTPLDDSRRLNECEIATGSILILVYRVRQIRVVINTQSSVPETVTISSNAPVSDLRKAVKRRVRAEGIGLLFNGEELSDSTRLDSVGIFENSVVDVIIHTDGGAVPA